MNCLAKEKSACHIKNFSTKHAGLLNSNKECLFSCTYSQKMQNYLSLNFGYISAPTRHITQNTSPPQDMNFLATENGISENTGSHIGSMM